MWDMIVASRVLMDFDRGFEWLGRRNIQGQIQVIIRDFDSFRSIRSPDKTDSKPIIDSNAIWALSEEGQEHQSRDKAKEIAQLFQNNGPSGENQREN